MVVRRDLTDAEFDRLFRALADATRRDIVARLLGGEQTSISTLAATYDMSFAAVQKHVAALEEAGLVTKRQQARERIGYGSAAPIPPARPPRTELEEPRRPPFAPLHPLL